jgi:hypothetical protein
MGNSTASPDVFANIERLTAALADATTDKEKRRYFRAIARALEVLAGKTLSAIHGVVAALTEREGK